MLDWVCLWGTGLVALTVVISKFTVLAMARAGAAVQFDTETRGRPSTRVEDSPANWPGRRPSS